MIRNEESGAALRSAPTWGATPFRSSSLLVPSGLVDFGFGGNPRLRRKRFGCRRRGDLAGIYNLDRDLRRQDRLESSLEVAAEQVVQRALAAGADDHLVAAIDGGVLRHQ